MDNIVAKDGMQNHFAEKHKKWQISSAYALEDQISRILSFSTYAHEFVIFRCVVSYFLNSYKFLKGFHIFTEMVV
jgi:hypothetical protein